jgi:hypothetical protein
MEQTKYIPGTCNIGPQERRLRLLGGVIGGLVFLGLAIYFHLAAFPKWADYFLFIPALMGSVGLLQYYSHFCVNFGLRGLMNVDKPAFQTESILQAEFRALDRRKAWAIISTGLAISMGVTFIASYV